MKYYRLDVLFSAWDREGHLTHTRELREVIVEIDPSVNESYEHAAKEKIEQDLNEKFGVGSEGEGAKVQVIAVKVLEIFGELIGYEEAKYELKKKGKDNGQKV